MAWLSAALMALKVVFGFQKITLNEQEYAKEKRLKADGAREAHEKNLSAELQANRTTILRLNTPLTPEEADAVARSLANAAERGVGGK